MMEKEYKKAKNAYEKYNLNDEYGIEDKVLKYINERIEKNKEQIEEIIKIYGKKEKYEEIEKVIKEEINKKTEYKKQVNLLKRVDGFVSAKYKVSIGVVAVECYEVLEIVRYIIRGIKTRNAIIISDIEYEEKDEKNLILLIIKEALKKYGIDENLIQIMPYEECEYEKCDKVIYTYDNKEKIDKKESNKLYIYVENEDLREEANKEYKIEKEKGNIVEIVDGNINEAIDRINREISIGAVIYTKEAKKGYKFVNLVKSKNVFVNSTLQNIEEMEKSNDELLRYKKIMYELNI